MLHTLAIANYRSLKELVLPLGQLTVITGPNGSGKSNLYRALRLLSHTALGGAISSLAREGGISSAVWAGPERIPASTRRGDQGVQGGPRRKPVSIKLGFAGDEWSYSVEFGLAGPHAPAAFSLDPEIKREAIWHGRTWRAAAALADRRGPRVQVRNDAGSWQSVTENLAAFDSMLTHAAHPVSAPEVLMLREQVRSWRFYDSFRTDDMAPARHPQQGTLTPVLSHDGSDLAAALQTIVEIGNPNALQHAVQDAFPGAQLSVDWASGQYKVAFTQHGLLRPLGQAELSDGTLRYLLLIAALLTPRPPALMVLNEPETSLHPQLIPALARLIRLASQSGQVWVVTHSTALSDELHKSDECESIILDKELGETHLLGQGLLNSPSWHWPPR